MLSISMLAYGLLAINDQTEIIVISHIRMGWYVNGKQGKTDT